MSSVLSITREIRGEMSGHRRISHFLPAIIMSPNREGVYELSTWQQPARRVLHRRNSPLRSALPLFNTVPEQQQVAHAPCSYAVRFTCTTINPQAGGTKHHELHGSTTASLISYQINPHRMDIRIQHPAQAKAPRMHTDPNPCSRTSFKRHCRAHLGLLDPLVLSFHSAGRLLAEAPSTVSASMAGRGSCVVCVSTKIEQGEEETAA
jgi:hypothetical protein